MPKPAIVNQIETKPPHSMFSWKKGKPTGCWPKAIKISKLYGFLPVIFEKPTNKKARITYVFSATD